MIGMERKIFYMAIALTTLSVSAFAAHLFSSSTLPPTSATNVIRLTGGQAWTSPTSVYSDDGSYASNATTGPQSTKYLWMTGFGFSIPTGATIQGVKVKLNGKEAWTFSPAFVNSYVWLVNSGTTLGQASQNPKSGYMFDQHSTDYDVYMGSSTDLWYTSLTPGIVNSSSFGTAAAFSNDDEGGRPYACYIDYCEITVWWGSGSGLDTQHQTRRAVVLQAR